MSLKIKEALSYGKEFLKNNKIKSFSLDAEIILSYVTGFSKIELVTKDNSILKDENFNKYKKLLERRSNFEPVQYIINKCEFMGLDFYVDKNVLIPRPDTEILVEEAIKEIKINNFKNILEIGTGSGAISVSLTYYLENIFITAVDISDEALDIAKKNAEINCVSDRIDFINSDITKNISGKKFDCIISNPPYIETDVIETLEKNVKDYEPKTALDGGLDGLYFYREIIKSSSDLLEDEGRIFFEIGFNQGESVKNLLKKDFCEIRILKDYSDFDRVVTCKKG